MSPARLETEIYPYLKKYKTVEPKSWVIKKHQTSGLPAEIERVDTNKGETRVRFSSFEEYGGVPREIQTKGDTTVERTVEPVRRQSGCLPASLYVATVTLRGGGSSMSYKISGGLVNRPDKVTITHI